MKLSVIIPTYNRAEILLKTLRAFESQSLDRKDFEILILNDGSPDNTSQVVKDFASGSQLNIRLFDHDNQGVAKNRNRGIKEAKADIVLFMNDDMMPASSDVLEKHLHNVSKDVACLGRIDWHPELKRTEVMEYLSPSGPLFNFSLIRDFNDCGGAYFFATNLSMHKRWFDLEMFDENHPIGHEDIELGYRLSKSGLKIRYYPDIKVLHHHYHADFDEYLKSKIDRRDSYDYLISKHPGLKGRLYGRLSHPLFKNIFLMCYKLTGLKYFRKLWWDCRVRSAEERGL